MIELKPTNPEVYAVVKIIEDTLNELEVIHWIQQDESNPDLWSISSGEIPEDDPKHPVIHLCFIGWDKTAKAVKFAGHDMARTARNEKEGMEPDEAMSLLDLKTIDMTVLWLTGDFHRILSDAQRKMVKLEEWKMKRDEITAREKLGKGGL